MLSDDALARMASPPKLWQCLCDDNGDFQQSSHVIACEHPDVHEIDSEKGKGNQNRAPSLFEPCVFF